MDLILVIIIIALPLLASIFVRSTYNKYVKTEIDSKLTGFEVARKILDKNGLKDIHIVKISGSMSDHYDPKRKVVRLSNEVFNGTSVASVSIAAHEVGHALQDKDKYIYMNIRSFIFPVVKFTSSIAYYVILIGFLLEILSLAKLGIIFVSLGLIFQIITLPVEFNASNRAKKELKDIKTLTESEISGSEEMLLSAALTYVAGVLASALQILRLILSVSNRDY